jgi:hypothetical protein
MGAASGADGTLPAAEGETRSADRIGGERVMAQLGGVSGLIYPSLPVLVFVAASRVVGLPAAVGMALGAALVILLWRLVRRESVQPAMSGFIGVAVCVLIAYVVGESKGYFLLGIWISLFWAAVFALSVLIRRPVVGYLWRWFGGHHDGWRDVRHAVYAFDVATLTWTLVFGARFAVQRLLYDADQTGWLVVARIAMGWPLTAASAVVTYLAIKVAQRALQSVMDSTVSAPAEAADATSPPPR